MQRLSFGLGLALLLALPAAAQKPDSVRAHRLDPVVVTGTMKQVRVSESPVKVDVIPAAALQRTVTSNLMETLQLVNGLTAQIDCGVCYTNSIRINGMAGPYTAVLIDGMPIMSALASVYGLNGINPALIDRLEIVKGPSSTLYGSEAMAGVVNVITKTPRFAPRVAVDAYATSFGEHSVDFAASGAATLWSGLASGSVTRAQSFSDENGDGFSDAPLFTRAALFGRADRRRPDGVRTLRLSAKAYAEDRFGGVEAWTPSHRGSGEVYGESVVTRRAELIGEWLLPTARDALRTEFSLTHHEQDSWYGETVYAARQRIAFGNLIWDAPAIGDHTLLLGLSGRHTFYDDGTPATVTAERRFVPGVFAQDEWAVRAGLDVLTGFRVDHHDAHGVIASPRLAVRWQPLHHTTLRLNAGTGFRVVSVFTEDHAALTGARRVVFEEELRPERSISVALNVNQTVEPGVSPLMIDLDLFHTRFSNRILPDYDSDPDLIVYRNLRGTAVTRGASLSLNQNIAFERLLYTVGATVQDVFIEEDGRRRDETFAPSFTATWGLTWNSPRPLFTLDYSGRVTGPMRLPSYPAPFERATRSRAWSTHDLRATVPVGRAAVYIGVRNLFDFTQPSPLIDARNPFSDAFDTTWVWGPIQGRALVAGARWGLSR